jgi:hypothetical protein
MKRLILPLLLLLVGYPVVRFGMRLTLLQEPLPAAAEFRLATVNGRAVGPRMCEGGVNGARMVLGRNGRWWIRDEICAPVAGHGVSVGNYQWAGDTLILHRIGARPGERPMARTVLRGDTVELANTSLGIHAYRYVRVPLPRK